MSEQAIEGRVVGRTSRSQPAMRQGPSAGSAPRTEYVYVQDKGTGRRGYREVSYGRNGNNARTRVPSGVPSFLGNREVILGAWAVSMVAITFDEWKYYSILPRPLRLWEATLVYAGLAIVSIPDALVPIANALAIGYTLTLLYQFFSGTGNFGGSLGSAATGTTQAPGTTTAGGRG